jgi:Uma2 family endonuclease
MVLRADHVPGPPQGCWTVADYDELPDDGRRYELVDGVLYMAAAPNTAHQAALVRFTAYLFTHVELTGLGRVFAAPTDVELPTGAVFEPDIVVVLNANLSIVTHKRIVGVPDLVIEITSPGTAGYDRRTKQDGYAAGRIPEYWHADPYARTIEILRLEGGAYQQVGVFENEQTLRSLVLPNLPVRVEQFFA